MSLNEAQSRAVAHKEGPMLVLAGPGSGKTSVITQRTKYLIEHGVHPGNILVVTFTKAAAAEMRHRFTGLMGGERCAVTFGTFHGIYFGILKHAYGYSGADVLGEDQKIMILKDILKYENLDIEDEGEFLASLISEISSVKNGRIDLAHYYSMTCPENTFRHIYEMYGKRLLELRKIDFDDMLLKCYELFDRRPDILAAWQKKFQYILIDEFQDVNQIQYDIIKMLAKPENNLFIVGDDDQSIYRFRGAKPEIMLNFPNEFQDARQVLLNINYRCNPHIVEAAGKLIVHNSRRFPKEVKTKKDSGAKVEILTFEDQRKENLAILKKMKQYTEQGIGFQDMAVLFRTNKDGLSFAELFMEFGIPFQMRDRIPNLYEHWVALDLFAYLRLSKGEGGRADLLRIMNKPKRYVHREALDDPDVSFETLRFYYEDKEHMCDRIDKLEDDLKWIAELPPFAAVNYIRKIIGYDEYLKDYAEFRKIKPDDFVEVLEQLQESAKPFQSFEKWYAHSQKYAKELKEQAQKKKEQEDGVSLMTLHSSKGLEYEVVFIADVNEGTIPYHKAVLDADLEEERRMFYVGMTRAKEYLHLYSSKERYHKKQEFSRFIEEILGEENNSNHPVKQ